MVATNDDRCHPGANKQKGQSEDWPKCLKLLVGAAGFENGASRPNRQDYSGVFIPCPCSVPRENGVGVAGFLGKIAG